MAAAAKTTGAANMRKQNAPRLLLFPVEREDRQTAAPRACLRNLRGCAHGNGNAADDGRGKEGRKGERSARQKLLHDDEVHREGQAVGDQSQQAQRVGPAVHKMCLSETAVELDNITITAAPACRRCGRGEIVCSAHVTAVCCSVWDIMCSWR